MPKRASKANTPPDEHVDFGDEPIEQLPLATLEQKYREQMRQIFPTKIDLPIFGLKTQIEAQINLSPEFQRRDRWPNKKRSRFIESIIMNIPVPPVFLGEEQYGRYEVLDGRQRLTALYLFLSNDMTLEGLEIWSELNGLKFADVKKKGMAATLERRFLPAVLLTKESSPEVKYEVFDRLNTGGVIAEQMEVRNAVFRGKFTDALHEFSSNTTFRKLWGIPVGNNRETLEKNSLYKTMQDLELVLRFFALQGATMQKRAYKDHLSIYMDERNGAYEKDPRLKQRDETLFLRAVGNCQKVFGLNAFRKEHDPGKDRSAPFADAVMQALAMYEEESLTEAKCKNIRTSFEKLFKDPHFVKAISSGTNGESAIKTRITSARQAVQAAVQNASRGRSRGR